MLSFAFRRLLGVIPVVFLTSVIVFGLMRLLPGDPVQLLVGQSQAEVSAATIEALRHQYLLDQPIWLQYLAWARHLLVGDFGHSLQTHQAVWVMIRPRILPTAQIGFTAWILALVVAVPLGAVTARHPGSLGDWVGTVTTLSGAAMPYFLIGGVLIFVVALRLGWLPPSGYVPPGQGLGPSIRSTILPAVTLSLSLGAVIARQARASFNEVLQFPYIRSARAKGLSELQVMTHHAFKNAMLPVVTILGVQLATMFSGAVVTETIFAIPGIGRLLVDAILGRDYPVVQAVVLLITIVVVVANLLVDIIYGLLDPRIRRA
ncbi:MAG TPA: ABC transporter permease [Acetobacteraceae bacterium]